MKSFKIYSASLFPAFLLLFGAFLTSSLAFAQTKNEPAVSRTIVTSRKDSKLKKIINVDDIDGEKVVVVTTIKDGNTTYETYKGDAAEEYLERSAELITEEAYANGFKYSSDDDEIKVTMKTMGDMGSTGSQIIWIGGDDEDQDLPIIKASSVNVEDENGVITINANVLDEKGSHIEKMIILEETDVVESMDEMQRILEGLGLDAKISIDMEGGKEVKSIIVCKKIVIEENGNSVDMENAMFTEFSVSPNPSYGELMVNFEPVNKGKVVVTVLDMKGNVLFMDSYNGKSAYSKNINITNYKGVVMLKVEQGENVEVRKLIIE